MARPSLDPLVEHVAAAKRGSEPAGIRGDVHDPEVHFYRVRDRVHKMNRPHGDHGRAGDRVPVTRDAGPKHQAQRGKPQWTHRSPDRKEVVVGLHWLLPPPPPVGFWRIGPPSPNPWEAMNAVRSAVETPAIK